MDLDMYVSNGTQARDGASRRPRTSDADGSDDESRRRTRRPRVATPSRSLAVRTLLRVATLCSGIEAVIQGYENLRVPHVHVAGCDNNTHVQPSVVNMRCSVEHEVELVVASFATTMIKNGLQLRNA